MLPAYPASLPIPADLRRFLPSPLIPWNLNFELFNRVRSQSEEPTGRLNYKTCVVGSDEPEARFILRYFEQNKPTGYSIKRIVCIHNPTLTNAFEAVLPHMEDQAVVEKPNWPNEDFSKEREKAIRRWKTMTDQFSPLEIMTHSSTGSRTVSLERIRVVPVWHGAKQKKLSLICSNGFKADGKHHYEPERGASPGPDLTTDIGYYGSGIYFTNSAGYASKYSDGYIMLAWVSLREPYPVISDNANAQKREDIADIRKLQGGGHYQNYNAHFIPVHPIRPGSVEYYPCHVSQAPECDEMVVFNESQALPRFWVELCNDSPLQDSLLLTVTKFFSVITLPRKQSLLEQSQLKPFDKSVETSPKRRDYNKEVGSELLDSSKKTNEILIKVVEKQDQSYPVAPLLSVQPTAVKQLHETHQSILTSSPALNDPVRIESRSQSSTFIGSSVFSFLSSFVSSPAKTPIPSGYAFGKDQWGVIGDIGEEPPLPSDIEKILQSTCPFWPEKKVVETHLLILIPKIISAKSLTLNSLQELMEHSKKGQAIQYNCSNVGIKEKIEKVSDETPISNSYWILLTRDVIPESRSKSYDDQLALLKNTHYDAPRLIEIAASLFLDHLRTESWLYNDKQWAFTYSRCKEIISESPWPIVIRHGEGGLEVGEYNANNEYIGLGALRRL